MKIIGVIPARWASTRFEGKVLADINGKPMIQHVWERVKKSNVLDDVLIACDHDAVFNAAVGFGARAIMTKADHPSGTDRIAEAVKDIICDVVVNIQGDEPLIDAQVINDLAKVFEKDRGCLMGTIIKVINDADELANPNVVKTVIDKDGYALYFSRAAIPFNRDCVDVTYYKHLGIYAYTRDFLMKYVQLPSSRLEKAERLEQLRVLEAGYKIKTVITTMETIGVDTPADLVKVKEII